MKLSKVLTFAAAGAAIGLLAIRGIMLATAKRRKVVKEEVTDKAHNLVHRFNHALGKNGKRHAQA